MRELLWLLPIALFALLWWRARGASRSQLQALADRNAQRVDVRTAAEYAEAHAPDTLNIPLDQLARRCDELDRNRPVLLCCASGSRSAMATSVLKAQGFEAVNAGPWHRLNDLR